MSCFRISLARLRRGEVCIPDENDLTVSSVSLFRKIYPSGSSLNFSCFGSVDVRIGIMSCDGSLFPLTEKSCRPEISGTDIYDVIIPLDLAGIQDGRIRIEITAVSDAEIFLNAQQTGLREKISDRSDVLYDFIFPEPSFCSEEQLYFRLRGDSGTFMPEQRCVCLGSGSEADFLTYFNSYSAMKWSRYTNVGNPSVYLELAGCCEICLTGQYMAERFVIGRYLVSAKERSTCVIPVPENYDFAVIGVTVRNVASEFLSEEEHAAGYLHGGSSDPVSGCRRNDNGSENDCEKDNGRTGEHDCGHGHDHVKGNKNCGGCGDGTVNDINTVTIFGGGWLSSVPAVRDINLGIVITTFRREETVTRTVARMIRAVSLHPEYSDRIDFAVVDNGSTLRSEDLPGAQLISSSNLGGTGGFTRGLIYFQESGRHTHCLFMDDDASCEPGSVFRTMSFLRHAQDPALAVSGAMLYESRKYLQWENGAWFDGGCHSINRNFDLRAPEKIFENETETDCRRYGAWWFFFFPVKYAVNYSLPFFIRGDDIDFSYSNDFNVISLNGVSSWQEDFKTKESAMTFYMFVRSHLVHHMTLPFLRCTYFTLMKILWRRFRKYNNSCCYGTAACINLALAHFLKGPEFFEENIHPVEILKKIAELSSCEKNVSCTEEELRSMALKPAENLIKGGILSFIIRRLSFNGHLLPDFMIRKTPDAMIFKSSAPSEMKAFLRSQITVVADNGSSVQVLRRSRSAYFRNLSVFLYHALRLAFLLPSLRRKYRCAAVEMRGIKFWKRQFKSSGAHDKGNRNGGISLNR